MSSVTLVTLFVSPRVSVSTAQCRAHTHLYITLQRTCVTCPTTAIFTHSGPACAVQKLRVAFHGSFGAPALTETRRFGILFFYFTQPKKKKTQSRNYSRGVTVAHHPFYGCAQLNIAPQFCACCFSVHIGSVLGTFSSPKSFYSSVRARSFPRHISFRVTKIQ